MSTSTSKTADEAKRDRDAEEARRAGTAQAPKDEPGSEKNPNIPHYISKAPWYLEQGDPGLLHQKAGEADRASFDRPARRGVTNKVAVRFRKGACENCGAMSHDAKSCVERPRKKGAKFTNADICPDEYIVENSARGYDASRDRWAGFDSSTHLQLVDEYRDLEHERAVNKIMNASKEDLAEEEEDQTNETFDCKDDKTRTTTRNLRIREDIAKYLINLDVNSAYYDPKSRAMREDPLIGVNSCFKGDDYYTHSEETFKPKELEVRAAHAQVFAWESKSRGIDVDFVGNPTQLEQLYNASREKEQREALEKRRELIARFNAAKYIENYDELKPLTRVSREDIVRSSDDVEVDEAKLLGHSQIWGSFYDRERGLWGYKCCGETVRARPCKQ